ncbi:MAG: BON domain-containing protein [Burkholderiales bacterium]
MREFRFLPIVTLAGLLSLPGCVPVAVVGAGAAGAISYEDRRTTGTQVDDEGIELRISNRISERYGDKVHVNATSFNRGVLLTGEVPDEKAKQEIGKLAASASNVRVVTNELTIGAPSSFGARAGDSAITGKVKARFVDAGKFSAVHVKVVTEASVVFLLGIVTETEANLATEIARTTGGVRKVVKVFDYCKLGEPGCAPTKFPADAKKPEAQKK